MIMRLKRGDKTQHTRKIKNIRVNTVVLKNVYNCVEAEWSSMELSLIVRALDL